MFLCCVAYSLLLAGWPRPLAEVSFVSPTQAFFVFISALLQVNSCLGFVFGFVLEGVQGSLDTAFSILADLGCSF